MFRCFGAAALLTLSLWPDAAHARAYSLSRRDIGCAELALGRGRQIWEAIAASLTWQWMGHAEIAPGYKPSFEGIRQVYCKKNIGKIDLSILNDLKTPDPKRKYYPDWRLESGADTLLRIVINIDGSGDEPITSIFNPQNPDHLLKKGCS